MKDNKTRADLAWYWLLAAGSTLMLIAGAIGLNTAGAVLFQLGGYLLLLFSFVAAVRGGMDGGANAKRVTAGSRAGAFFLALIASLTVMAIAGQLSQPSRSYSQDYSSADIQKLVDNYESTESRSIERPTYVQNCIDVVMGADNNLSELSTESIESYCACVYDDGVAELGENRFLELDEQVARGGNAGEIRPIVDSCFDRTIR